VNAIFYIIRSGEQWRLLPHDLPAWQTVYQYFRLWRLDETWGVVSELFLGTARNLAITGRYRQHPLSFLPARPLPPPSKSLQQRSIRCSEPSPSDAQHPDVQRLQLFLSESTWDANAINARRLELAAADPLTRPHDDGVLVIDNTGDCKDGRKTDHVARQYLGSIGKIENGIVAVTSLWADERVYYPLHVQP